MPAGTRYSAWDGSQQIGELEAGEVLDAITEDLTRLGDVEEALANLVQQGLETPDGVRYEGLEDLQAQIREEQDRLRRQFDLGGPMEDLARQLQEIIARERDAIDRGELGGDGEGEPGGDGEGEPGGDGEGEPGGDGEGEPGGDGEGEPGGDGEGEPGGDGEGEPGGDGEGEPGGDGEGEPGGDGEGEPGGDGEGEPGGDGEGEPGGDGEGEPGGDGEGEPGGGGFGGGLDAVPGDVVGRIKALRGYRFADQTAAARFAEIDGEVGRAALEALLPPAVLDAQGEAGNPGDVQRMLGELRNALEARGADLEAFVEDHANVFQGAGDEAAADLIERMREQMAAAEALADAAPGDHGRAIRDLLAGAFGDADLVRDIIALTGGSEGDGGRGDDRFGGTDEIGLQEALRLMGEMRRLGRLAEQMEAARNGIDGGIESELLRKVLGNDVADGVQQLAGVADALERDGLLRREEDGWELTPRAIRMIGQRALSEIYAHLKRADLGNHPIPEAGRHGERLEETKPYEFGDPFHLHMGRTIMNAVARNGASTPVRLEPGDFEVHRSELLTATATVVLVDLSWSMVLRGAFQAAKKVALALHNLTVSQYPHDQIYVIGFAGYARELKIAHLPEMQWDEETIGTNVQHGLMMARRRLAKHRAGTRQIIMITDGEPTAHMVDGESRFSYPVSQNTIPETMREVRRCAKERITLNTFMLVDEPQLRAFADQVARVNGGRVFQTSCENLGEYVVADYVRHKRHRIARTT